jgi:hypothetical protein
VGERYGAAQAKREAQETMLRMEVEGTMVLASARGEAEDLVRRVALVEVERAEAHQAREAAEENS